METRKNQIAELVVYRIKSECRKEYVGEVINSFKQLVMSLKGFISYDFFQGCKDENLFMDLVFWDSLENAELEAKKVKEIQKGEEFKDYIESFESVILFNHFNSKN